MSAEDVDLNLLRVLDALLQEGSVKGAATRLHLSAPAVSRSLARLRRALEDPLFVRSGRALVPTALAVALRDEVRLALVRATAVLTPEADAFDPSVLSRRFVVSAGDALTATLGLSIVDRVVSIAPGVEFAFLPDTNERELLRSASVDLDLGPPHVIDSEIESEVLFIDRFVLAFRADHAFASQRVTLRRLARARHLVVSTKGARDDIVDLALAKVGLSKKQVTVVPSFVVAIHLAATSDAVVVVPSAVVSALGEHQPITFADLPFATPNLPLGQSWHSRFNNDPAHRWLREQIGGLAREQATFLHLT